MRGQVIGLTGRMGSGKDTVAKLLSAADRGSFQRVAYGDKLKDLFFLIFGRKAERHELQFFGQAMRRIDPNIWVRYADERARMLLERGHNVVVTDVRQPNEVDHIKRLGGVLVRVNVSDQVRLERLKQRGDNVTVKELEHETEQYVGKFKADFELYNNMALESLERQVDGLLWWMQERAEQANG